MDDIEYTNRELSWRLTLSGIAAPPDGIKYPRLRESLLDLGQSSDEHVDIPSTYRKQIDHKIDILHHKFNVIHGDLHVDNIVLIDDEPYFIDFEFTNTLEKFDLIAFSQRVGLVNPTIDDVIRIESKFYLH